MAKEIVNNPETLHGYKVVQDGKEIYEALQKGETVMHWESGNSMFPLLKNMEYCKIYPVGDNKFVKDTILGKPVFCSFKYRDREDNKIKDAYMVHRCTEVYERDGELYFKIESTDGTVFGWTTNVYGIAESTNIFQDEMALWN